MARKKKLNIRIIKLRSGEELVSDISGKTKTKMTLNRPMEISNSLVNDPFTNIRRNVVYLQDWLDSSCDIKVDIPIESILVELPPDPNMCRLYEDQMNLDDTGEMIPPKNISDKDMKKFTDSISADMKNFMKDCDKFMQKNPKQIEPHNNTFPDFMKNPLSMVQFTLCISAETITRWAETGLLDYLKQCISDFMNEDFMNELMEAEEEFMKSKKRKMTKKQKPKRNDIKEEIAEKEWTEPTEAETKNDQFGNNIKDWSPYLKDYFKDKPPPHK